MLWGHVAQEDSQVLNGSLVSRLIMGPEFWDVHFPLDAAVENTWNWLGFHAHYGYKNV